MDTYGLISPYFYFSVLFFPEEKSLSKFMLHNFLKRGKNIEDR